MIVFIMDNSLVFLVHYSKTRKYKCQFPRALVDALKLLFQSKRNRFVKPSCLRLLSILLHREQHFSEREGLVKNGRNWMALDVLWA